MRYLTWSSNGYLAWVLLELFLPCGRGDSFDNAINDLMSNQSIRGAAIAYFNRNVMPRPVARGYGKVASSSSSANVDADTAFMLASVAKVFTASAVAKLVEMGVITLDSDICDVIPRDWQRSACRNPNFPDKKITWRMMVTHRSSLKGDIPDTTNSNGVLVSPSYGPSGGYVSDYPAAGNPTCPLTDVQGFYRDLLTDKPTETTIGYDFIVQGGGHIDWYELGKSQGSMWASYQPGAQQEYSNLAAGYVAALVELATGQNFETFCKEKLFLPLGMTNTAWFKNSLPPGTKVAVPVEKASSTSWTDIGHYCFIDYASGELRMTANDCVKWGDEMLNYGTSKLWSQSTANQVFKCQELDQNGNQVSNCEFALGWVRLDNSMKGQASTESWLRDFEQFDWTDGVWHDGSEGGCQTNAIVLPKAGVYVFALTNTDLNGDLAAQRLTSRVVTAPLPTIEGAVPTRAPVRKPTSAPIAPVRKPTSAPIAPVRKPTSAPIAPVRKPTSAPIAPVRKPTSAPIPKPSAPKPSSASCVDTWNGVFWTNSNHLYQSCQWLSTRPSWQSKLCGSRNDASYYCRATCKTCNWWNGVSYNPAIKFLGPIPTSDQCINAAGQFWVDVKIGYKDCAWLSTSATWRNQLCGYDVPADFVCQKLCGSCDAW